MKHIIVKRIRFEKDGFAIIVAQDDDNKSDVYLGNFPHLSVGAEYTVEVEEKMDPKWGKQYKVLSAKHTSNAPANPDSVRLYLLSGAIFGCGPVLAQKIYDTFGDDSLNVIRNDWTKLETIPGISSKKAQQIHDGEANAKSSTGLLGIPGMTKSKAEKVFAFYGNDAQRILQQEPYQITYDIKGFGFKISDALAMQQTGFSETDPRRIGAAITFVLYELDKEGHCYCAKKKMTERVQELTGVSEELIHQILDEEVKAERVIIEGRSIYARKVYDVECETAKHTISLFTKEARFTEKDARAALAAVGEGTLVDEQKFAVLGALTNNIYAITGGAGCGKTTVINTIAKMWKHLCKDKIVMCAPTGKAARRMTEATGCKAITSARLTMKESEHPENALIICDEASMLDMWMARDLINVAYKGNNQIIFVGDVSQLPPVGAGTFFRDILESEIIRGKKLWMCHRQSGIIAENANKINKGCKLADLEFDGVHTNFLYGNTVEAAVKAYKKAVEKYGVENVCLLLPFRQARGTVPATSSANFILRPAYNKNKPRANCIFADGDRVLNLVNDPENDIANGDVGTVKYSGEDKFVVLMDSGAEITYNHSAEKHFDLAYALTIHKSQGSEYDCVILLLTNAAFIMLERNLVYTAVTRGKKEVIMMGDKKAFSIALNSQKAIKRNTKLIERMHQLL